MIMVKFKIGLSEKNLMLGGLLGEFNTNVDEFVANNVDIR